MSTVTDLAMVPAHILTHLGLHTPGLTPGHVRDRLAALHTDDPELARLLADQIALSALRLVAAGHPRPAELAADAITVLDATGWRP